MIHLIYNKDIKALENKESLTLNELNLLRLGQNCKESKIQIICNNIAQEISAKYEYEFKQKLIEFVQVDNGDTSAGKLSDKQRNALFSRKKKEGTKRGFPDTFVLFGTHDRTKTGILFFELKRIGMPSQIKISDEQLYYHDFLNAVGFKSYITNNPNFFRKTVTEFARNFYSC